MSFLKSRETLARQGIGKSVPRREDSRFLTGAGRYAADFSLPGQAYAYLVRSPHAHARIIKIDATDSSASPGVLAVLTGGDAAADGLRPIPHSPVPGNPHEVPLKSRDGSSFFIAPHPVLAVDAVRYVGEPVAVVVAETLAREYYEFRATLMVEYEEGLTKIYNRFHNPDERSNAIGELRRLHDAMDRAVLDTYGWTDIRPACEFELEWEDDEAENGRRRQKPWRYRWPEPVRDEVLARLLALNARRAGEERAAREE